MGNRSSPSSVDLRAHWCARSFVVTRVLPTPKGDREVVVGAALCNNDGSWYWLSLDEGGSAETSGEAFACIRASLAALR